jgi:hypothetical protein
VSEPYRDDSFDGPAPEPEGHYVDDDLGHAPPYFLARCTDCGTLTTHAEFRDEHGSNRTTGCVICRRMLETPRPAWPLPQAWQGCVKPNDE